MKLTLHLAADYATAQQALLPPGEAWDWPVGGFGHTLLLGMAGELTRVEAAAQSVLDAAIDTHRPKIGSWHISEYQRVANGLAALQHAIVVEHLIRPLRVGSRVGDRSWSSRSRFIIKVHYYSTEIDPLLLWNALSDFKQAHVALWLHDVAGINNQVSYA